MSEYIIYFALLVILIQVSRLNVKASKIEGDVKRVRETTNKTYWNQLQEINDNTNV